MAGRYQRSLQPIRLKARRSMRRAVLRAAFALLAERGSIRFRYRKPSHPAFQLA